MLLVQLAVLQHHISQSRKYKGLTVEYDDAETHQNCELSYSHSSEVNKFDASAQVQSQLRTGRTDVISHAHAHALICPPNDKHTRMHAHTHSLFND